MLPDRPEARGAESSCTISVPHDRLFMESKSPAVRALGRIVADIASTEIPLLLIGESGTGKDVLAARIHQLSRRRHEPFVKVNCLQLDSECLEESIRGDQSDTAIRGLSSAGTLFLDEVGRLDLACQSKLLRVMPDEDAAAKEDCRHARLISSTTRNLEDEVRSGRFREELYYRLNGLCLRLPPLRQRKEDIPALVDFFLSSYAAQFSRPRPIVSPQMLRTFLEYSWPGNIRQLDNVVKKIVASGDERSAESEMSGAASESLRERFSAEGPSLKQAARAASRRAERELILKALERTRWNRKRAAKELQISYKALLYKLKQIGQEDSAGSLNPRGE